MNEKIWVRKDTNDISTTKEQLKWLFDKGILTEEEYENKRKNIL